MPAPVSEQESKDGFFAELSVLAERMTAAHGRDFAMGAFILAARFIAENKGGTEIRPAEVRPEANN